ncbi:MAG: DUF2971 domain-containing protein [Bacteroidales bacterium]|nr:DUF2971 domain-containing protein [Bacteroidales bacterium]
MKIIKNNNWDGVLIPPILYKYRDWDNSYHKTILTNNKLYFASPLDFEDQNDCRPRVKYPETQDEIFAYILKTHYICSNKSFKNYDEYRLCCKKVFKTSPLLNPMERDSILRKYHEDYMNAHGVLSVTENANNDYLWKTYANNHSGVCVGFDTNVLRQFIIGGAPITYYKELPTIDFMNDCNTTKIQKQIWSKSDKFKEEQEYRLIKIWPPDNHVITQTDRCITFPNEAVLEIILGKNMKEENKQEVRNIVKNKFVNARIIEQKK